MSEKIRVGEHILRVEAEDMVTISWTGHVGGEHVREMYGHLRRITRGKERLLYLADLMRMTTSDTDARRASAELLDMPGLRGIAGAMSSFQVRVICTLTVKVMGTLGKLRDCPILFFPTVDEARAWLDARRRALTKAP